MTNPYTQPNHKTIQNESAPPDRAYIRRRRIFSILSLAVVLAFFTWVTIAVGKPLVELASDPEQFRVWVDQYGIWGRFILIGIMTLQVVVAMIPGEIIEIGAGYAFGAIEGTPGRRGGRLGDHLPSHPMLWHQAGGSFRIQGKAQPDQVSAQ